MTNGESSWVSATMGGQPGKICSDHASAKMSCPVPESEGLKGSWGQENHHAIDG